MESETTPTGTAEATELKTPLDPEQIDQLLLDDISAIAEKVKNGKPLTTAEIKRLQAYKNAAAPESTGNEPLEPIWAKNLVELAKHLGCSRRQLGRYIDIEGEDAPPEPTSDGRYNVTLWKIWAAEHGHLKKKLSTAADRQLLEDRTIQLRNEKLEIENAIQRGELMSVDEVCRVITEMTAGVVDTARSMKHVLAPRVVGLTVPEATKRIGQEVDTNLLTKLSLGEWAKKKVFWSKVSAHLSDLRKRFNLGVGLSETS